MPLRKVLSMIAAQTLFFMVLGAGMWVASDRSLANFVTVSAIETVTGLALAAALIATSATLARLFPSQVAQLVRSQARNYPFLKHRISMSAIVFISLCAGIGEEALFRGGLQTWLGDYAPLPLALLVSAALFALIHFAQPLNSALIFVIGCLFGVVYMSTQSLLTVMIAHAVYDVYALWTLQNAMHELNVFAEEPSPDLPANAGRETFDAAKDSKGETL